LNRLRQAGIQPNIITVLHPEGLNHPDQYYQFYRDNGITNISFSIDEMEGANATSSFAGGDYKERISDFLLSLLELAYSEEFPLSIREIERIAQVLAGLDGSAMKNEQVEAWDVVVIAANGSVSTFSPEFMEVSAPNYSNFVFGNILTSDFDNFFHNPAFTLARAHVEAGVEACRSTCKYFAVCKGGSPVNKFCELKDLASTETAFCRYSIQAAADALLRFLARPNIRAGFQVNPPL
jgi:uncharacterized protein